MSNEETTTDAHVELAQLVLHRALAAMSSRGVPFDVVLDRFVTFAAGAHVQVLGSERAAACFREYASRIQAGAFDHASGPDQTRLN